MMCDFLFMITKAEMDPSIIKEMKENHDEMPRQDHIDVMILVTREQKS
jgi:hypothetical protein